MRNEQNTRWLLVILVLTVAAVLSVGIAFGRYQTEITGDLAFQAKPGEGIVLADQQWHQEDGNAVLTFSVAEDVESCRIYLTISEGVTAPDTVQVTLNIPQEAYSDEETGEIVTPDDLVLTATGEEISPDASLYALFGSGYVFCFQDEEGETVLDLKAGETYTLTVTNIGAAVEHTSLLRLFVEQAR